MSCNTSEHNHKDFTCSFCNEDFIIRDDSKICVCFDCCLFPLCSTCVYLHKDKEYIHNHIEK